MGETIAFLGLILGAFVIQLSEEWRINPQYSYGWGVPVLGIILAWKRWQDCPPAESSTAAVRRGWVVVGAMVLLLWLPVRIIREANMDWRLVQWIIGLGAVLLLLAGVYATGGRSWQRHFLVPIFFLLLAVPWPTRLETILVQGLTEPIVRAAVEALRWMGQPAWSAGNVINVSGTSVGIDEACSGLRSFQGSVMCAVFFGELRRLSVLKRFWLVGIAALLALVLNLLRTIVLAGIATSHDVGTVEAWHDGAGLLSLVILFVLLHLLTCRISPKPAYRDSASASLPRGIPRAVIVGLAAWLVVVEVGTACWFRSREAGTGVASWILDASAVPGLRPEAIPARTQSILRFDKGDSFRRTDSEGMQWWIHNFVWSRDGGGAPLARFHSPDVCLPAAGLKLVARGPLFSPAGTDIPFRAYEFDWQGKPVFVFSSFYSSTEAGAIESMAEFDLTWGKRLWSALAGQRPADQRVFQVMIAGTGSQKIAREAFEEFALVALKRQT